MTRRCWTPLGPTCVSLGSRGRVEAGRFNAVAVDPSDPTGLSVYAGADTGGLWKTTNGGVTWSPKGDQLSTLTISAILVAPTPNGKFLFIGTGEPRNSFAPFGVGVLVSPDDGETWDVLPTPNPMIGRRVNALQIAPLPTPAGEFRRVWAATNSGLWFSNLTVRKWLQLESGTWTSIGFSQGVLVGARSGEGIFRDDGTSMKRLFSFPFQADRVILAVAPSNTNVMYAAAGTNNFLSSLVRSDDGGNSWRELSFPRDGGLHETIDSGSSGIRVGSFEGS